MTNDEPNREAYHLAGDRLGPFVILSELGRGSMGVVYEALHGKLNRKVALKVLPANISLDQKQVERFHREAESVARLRHENIIQIYEVGKIENTNYFAMELVDGARFGQATGRDREGIQQAAKMARDAARGLAHAHGRGVIHRDIKPGNMLVDRSGRVVVTDFGLARLSESASLTSTDAIVGTPKYMSPEQIVPGKYPLDGRTDVYALGATLYEALAGRPPIDEPSVQAFLRAILEQRPPSPRRFNREIPHDLATIILRCLEKEPADRYANASDLADDLDRYLAGERIKAKPRGAIAIGYELVRRHRLIASFAAVALIALVVGLWESGRARDASAQKDLSDQAFRLANIAAEQDIDLAIAQAEDLVGKFPEHEAVRETRRLLYKRRAREGLECGENDLYVEGVLRDLERAGLAGTHWHLVMLVEAGRFEDARGLAVQLPDGSPDRELTLASLDLRAGAYRRATERLEPLAEADEVDPLALLVLSQAYRALATVETGEMMMKYAEKTRTCLQRAYELSRSIDEQWLRDRIFVRKLADFQGETAAVRDLLPNLGGTLEAISGWRDLWVGMSKTESDILDEFAGRILTLAGVPANAQTDQVFKTAKAQIAAASDDRDRVLGNLLLAVYHLNLGLPAETEKDLDAAANSYHPELMPYVYWGKSVALRARGKLHEAINDALVAVEMAGALPAFRDLRSLALHATILAEEAGQTDGRAAAQVLEKELTRSARVPASEPWVIDLLDRWRRLLAAGSVPGR